MLPVELHEPLLVLLHVGSALALIAVHHVLVVLRPLLAQVHERHPPQRVRNAVVREDEVLEPMRPVRRAMYSIVSERDAPGLHKDVKFVADAPWEVADELIQLGDDERRHEKARGLVMHASGLARAKLVVQDDRLAVCLMQIGVWEYIRVG